MDRNTLIDQYVKTHHAYTKDVQIFDCLDSEGDNKEVIFQNGEWLVLYTNGLDYYEVVHSYETTSGNRPQRHFVSLCRLTKQEK